MSAFDYTYERKKRGNALSDKKQLNVFEDGSLKKANAIEIIDEMLDYKKMYQLEQSKLEQKNLEKMTPMIEDSDDAVIKEIDALMGDIAFKTEL